MNNFLILFFIALSYNIIIIFCWINEPFRRNDKYRSSELYLSLPDLIDNKHDIASTESNSIIKRRRIRYSGKYPKHFNEKYKEKIEDQQIIQKVIAKGGTPAGQHRPIMLDECMKYLNLEESSIITTNINKQINSKQNTTNVSSNNKVVCIDCTLGFGGHSMEILKKIIPMDGILYGLDQDQKELEKTEIRLRNVITTITTQDNSNNIDDKYLSIHHENFGNLLTFSKNHDILGKATSILVDLGYSSMQIDDPSRGFTYKYQGPLDMRMNATTTSSSSSSSNVLNSNDSSNHNLSNNIKDTLTAYQYLTVLKHPRKFVNILKTNSDIEETYALSIAHAIYNNQLGGIPNTTFEFADRIRSAYIQVVNDIYGNGNSDKLSKSSIDSMVARCFQALRIEVNSEFHVLDNMLEALPYVLAPNGHAVILTFHSGEDRRVKKSFKKGFNDGIFQSWSRDVVIATNNEKHSNPRAKCCKLRWVIRSSKVL